MASAVSAELIRTSVNAVAQILALELKEELTAEKRKRKWVRKWISRRSEMGATNTLIKELTLEDENSFVNHFRMSKTNFEYLLSCVSRSIQRSDTRMRDAVPARVKLQVTLRYLASGDSMSSLQYIYRVPKNTISVFLCEVLDAIYDALKPYLKTPSIENEWKEIEKGFETRWNFPGCIGAIDGKHVMIQCPRKSGSTFFNYKGTFSIILLALVDSNYCFKYIDIGAAGRESDGGVFSRSQLKKAIEDKTLCLPEMSVIVGDDAFPLKTYLMKPYPRNGVLTYGQKIFNYRLSRARRIVENAFGILVSKFRIFEKPIPLQSAKVEKIVLSCCALHNWLRVTSSSYLTRGLPDNEHLDTGEVQPGSWRDIQANGLQEVTCLGSHNHSREAALVRDRYSQFFITTGSVPWQDSMI